MSRPLKTRNNITKRLESFVLELQTEGEMFLPSERKLCDEFGASRETIRRALEVLEDKKILIKEASKRLISQPKETRGSVAFVASGWGSICSSAWARLWAAFEPLAQANGIDVSLALYNWNDIDEVWPGKLESLPDVIVYTDAPNQMIADKIFEFKDNCPIIAVDEKFIGVADHLVTLDNYEAGRLAAQMFLDKGRTKPAFIGATTTCNYSPFLKRGRGFADALKEAGIEFGPESCKMLSVTPSNPDYNMQLAQYCEEIAQGHDSLFVYSDEAISTVYSAINKIAPMPEKFSLITLNGTTQCLSHSPVVSAISHASNEVAAGLVKLIMRILGSENNTSETILKMKSEVYHGETL